VVLGIQGPFINHFHLAGGLARRFGTTTGKPAG
jgi:hypothetical protein